jgi:hypothetical protein
MIKKLVAHTPHEHIVSGVTLMFDALQVDHNRHEKSFNNIHYMTKKLPKNNSKK